MITERKLNKIIIAAYLAVSLVFSGCGGGRTQPEVIGGDERIIEPSREAKCNDKQANLPPYKAPSPSAPSSTPGSLKGKVIIIDAGHGGKDPGTLGIKLGGSYGLPEKTINLDIAKKLAAKLTAMGATVKMTRTSDVFLELEDRAAFAVRYKADLFVSIHADYIENKASYGPTAFVARQAGSASIKAAEAVVREFERSGITTKGVRRADYKVLVEHPKPATLVEVGYLSNYAEAKKLNTDSYRTKVASIVAAAIANSF